MAAVIVQVPPGAKTNIKVEITIPSGSTSEWYILPPGLQQIVADVLPGSGATVKLQYTNDDEGAQAGTAIPIDWDPGEVTVATGAAAPGVRAIRGVGATLGGTIILNCVQA